MAKKHIVIPDVAIHGIADRGKGVGRTAEGLAIFVEGAVPGDVVDVAFTPNSSPRSARVGDDEVVPAEVAAARDALRTAIQAAL